MLLSMKIHKKMASLKAERDQELKIDKVAAERSLEIGREEARRTRIRGGIS